ncbi:MAG: hypothetical protein HY884_05275 [Deltaproteobacteria bacterium]|nr:hypothetical protein [Deltaproteobacteria bacterium]
MRGINDTLSPRGCLRKSGLVCIIAAIILTLFRTETGQAAEESLSLRGEAPPTERPRLLWGKDPFVPLVSTNVETGAGTTAALKLTAIFFNKDKPSAIINDRIVYVGSVINGQKIVDIGKTHVILHNKDGSIRLEFAGPPEADARK